MSREPTGEEPAGRAGADGRGRHTVFVLTILAGSFLLFLVQPLVARMALPRLGGAPAVWNSAMLVYQALLLGGYAYAHWLGRVRPRVQAGIHLAVLAVAALWLPIGLATTQLPADASPSLCVPLLLGLSIGPLFFAVSAQAPLIQRWYAVASGGRDPYALYAASNLGSFAGLIAYPLVVEPTLALHAQSLLWSGGYVLLGALVLACATLLPRDAAAGQVVVRASPAIGRMRVVRWIALALVPSGLMLATSTYLTTDIVAMPLLWVIPLGLYLLSFAVAFAQDQTVANLVTRVAPVTILLLGGVMIGGYQERPYFNAGVALLLLFMAATALHTALYRSRPEPDRLTGFYLAMSFGGVLGGVFAALLAPVLFDWTYEYPLLIFAAGALVPQGFLADRIRDVWWTHRLVAFGTVVVAMALLILLRVFGPAHLFGEGRQGIAFLVIALVGLFAMGARRPYLIVLATALMLFGGYRSIALSLQGDARVRSYFGVYTIRGDDKVRELDHGTTVHGIQLIGSPERERTPTTYYAPQSGIGRAMLRLSPIARVGVVGLGTGTLACYAKPAQRWRFYEIDPAIVRIARDSGQFTYLRHCLPDPIIRLGDARVRLAQEKVGTLDLLALDAFSSDAVPMHLMTQEAFAGYARVLAPDGLLLVHISNRFLDLEPVVASAARAGGWRARRLSYVPAPDATGRPAASVWIALSRDPKTLAALIRDDAEWEPLRTRPGFVGWTDDYATILPLMKGF